VVTQYPDTAVYTIPAAPVQDLSGNWYVTDGTAFTVACRAEYNSRNGVITMTDGQAISYDYTVYMAVHTTDIAPGTEVTVTMHNGRVVTGTVKRHENSQLNSKSWL